MSALKGYRIAAALAVLAVLAGCATNRIARCEGHLVPINPPPPKPAAAAPAPFPKPAMTTPAPAPKSPSPRNTERRP